MEGFGRGARIVCGVAAAFLAAYLVHGLYQGDITFGQGDHLSDADSHPHYTTAAGLTIAAIFLLHPILFFGTLAIRPSLFRTHRFVPAVIVVSFVVLSIVLSF